jgi:L-lactate dehydrogenase complex protein LldE
VRIALFITCVGDTLFPETGRSVTRVLERLGHDVVFPAAQTCCGQMHANSGYRADALRLARRLVDVLGRDDGVDAVVSPSSSCVGWLRELLPAVAREEGDERLAAEAEALGDRLFEFSEFLVARLGLEDVGATYPRRVTLHPTCHSLRVTHVGDAPGRLLAHVRGLEVLELPDATECCGFGGTFSVKNAAVSVAMLEDKCRAILSTGAEVVTAVDPSCLLHIGGGLSRLAPPLGAGAGPSVRAVHLADILAAQGPPRAAEKAGRAGGSGRRSRSGRRDGPVRRI